MASSLGLRVQAVGALCLEFKGGIYGTNRQGGGLTCCACQGVCPRPVSGQQDVLVTSNAVWRIRGWRGRFDIEGVRAAREATRWERRRRGDVRVLVGAARGGAGESKGAEDDGGEDGWDDEGEWDDEDGLWEEYGEDEGEWGEAEWEDDEEWEEGGQEQEGQEEKQGLEGTEGEGRQSGEQEQQEGQGLSIEQGSQTLSRSPELAIDYSVPLEEEGWPAVAVRVGQLEHDSLVEWLEGQPDWEALLWRLVNVPAVHQEWSRQEVVRRRRQWVSHAQEDALQVAARIEVARDEAEEALQDLAARTRGGTSPEVEELAAAFRHVADRRAQSSMGRLIAGTQAVLAEESNKTVKQQLSYYYRGLPQWIENEVDPSALGPGARQVAAVARHVVQQMEELCTDMEQELNTRAQAVYIQLQEAGQEELADRVGFHLLGGIAEAKALYAQEKEDVRRQLTKQVRLAEVATLDANKALAREFQEDQRDVAHGILSRRDLEIRKAFMKLEEDQLAPKQPKPIDDDLTDLPTDQLAISEDAPLAPPPVAASQFDPYALFAVRAAQAGLLPPLKHSDGTVLVSEAARARAFHPSLKQLRLKREREKKKAMGVEYFTSGAASGHHVGPQGGRVFPADEEWKPTLGPMSIDEEVDAIAEYLRTQSESDYLLMKGADIQINRDPITWDMTWADINPYFDGDSRICIDDLVNEPDEKLSFAGPEWERPQDAWEFIHTIGRLLPTQPDIPETVEYRSVPKWEKEWGPNPPPMLTPEDEPLVVPASEEDPAEAQRMEMAENVGDDLEDDIDFELPKAAFQDDEIGAGKDVEVDVKKLLKGATKEFAPRKGSTDALDRLNIKSLPDDLELLASEDEEY